MAARPMTPEAKRALSKTVRELRARLLTDLHDAIERTYRSSLDAKKAKLDEATLAGRRRLEGWIDEQVRGLPAKEQPEARKRFLLEVEKDAASTLLNRLVYLRLLEAAGLRQEKVVTGGWESRGYVDFRELAPELARSDEETEGYAFLLGLIYDELSAELPGLYGDVRLTSLVPIPAATLRALVEALDDSALESCWHDDTTLGWVYQYWNDPEREALDAKINAGGKIEPHEIAAKTQMFTERYMVEWLLQNTLGTLWLAMCRKHGWKADVEANGTLERLEERRKTWRARREAGEVALDELMPIEGDEEERWKYWVPQPIPDDAPGFAPERLRDLRLLDPACGSGHFLVIAFDLLFGLYEEEARHRGETITAKEIAETILEENLHGIDIDPRAVQIAAAALVLKARTRAPDAWPKRLNLVAPALRLARLPADDPARVELQKTVEQEAGIPASLTQQVLDALAGADHLGSLLRIDRTIDEAVAACAGSLGKERVRQTDAFESAPRREGARMPMALADARATLLAQLDDFLRAHAHGDDLGLRLRGEQLSAGLRFIELAREGTYDIVVGNPPYQGTARMVDADYVKRHYPRAKADLYAAFLERGLELARAGGTSALLTMRNWMFIQTFSEFRQRLLRMQAVRLLGDLGWGAFREMKDNPVIMSVLAKGTKTPICTALCPTDPVARVRTRENFESIRAGLFCQVGRFDFDPAELKVVPEWPLVYWWDRGFLVDYARAPKLGASRVISKGLTTCNNTRFIRRVWEVAVAAVSACPVGGQSAADTQHPLFTRSKWVPWVDGAQGRRWFQDLESVLNWKHRGLQIATAPSNRYGRGEDVYFRPGVAFTMIGSEFSGRHHCYLSIIGNMGASIYGDELLELTALLNSARSRQVLMSLNPGTHFEKLDVERLPVRSLAKASEVMSGAATAFHDHEFHREPSVEFRSPGPSPWRYAQDWAQRAVDRPEGDPLPPYEPELDPEPPTDHVSFALGVALGRFGADGEGILDPSRDDLSEALPAGICFLDGTLDSLSREDSLGHEATRLLRETWSERGSEIDPRKDLRSWLRSEFFASVHKGMYENRPIYFPLSSKSRTFVAFVSIHRATIDTLRTLLAEHLHPAKLRLDGAIADLRANRKSTDERRKSAAERRYPQLVAWRDELAEFIDKVEECAEKGPPPPDASTPAREVDARYKMDLDDGVMVNSAALWPLLEPQWKDPKKWWKELATAKGKKDYDWAKLAARYFPKRVEEKCAKDPSLAVAHGSFWKHHPAKAYAWELRLKDEIGPDFTLDEAESDERRAAFEHEHPDEVKKILAEEKKRRERKRRKAEKEKGDAGDPFAAWRDPNEREDAPVDDEECAEEAQEVGDGVERRVGRIS